MDTSDTTSSQKGSTLGATLLVAGCCIGAGMLGLPVLSSIAGFIPSLFAFVIAYLFMVITGLLLLEVNLWFKEEVNLLSMAERTLGKTGKAISWFLFLILFYSIMVAYTAGSGTLFSEMCEYAMGISIPTELSSLIFTCLFGIVIFRGTFDTDLFNRILMLGLFLTYVVLIAMGLPVVETKNLAHAHWGSIIYVFPAMIISFGYHNLIPSLNTYLARDVKKLKIAILLGCSIPLLIYLLWEFVILGIVPPGGFQEALTQGAMATHALKSAAGSSYIQLFGQYFAFFAIVTSFIAVALSFVDFLADGLRMERKGLSRSILCLLTLLPPLLFAYSYPQIFLKALNYGGAFAAILFGVIPPLMVWRGRYQLKIQSIRLIKGGKPVLFFIMLFSFIVVILELLLEFGVIKP